MREKNYNDIIFTEGMRVHYSSRHGKKENGKIKELRENVAMVVYHCNGEWDRYRDYTGAATNYKDLTPGWV